MAFSRLLTKVPRKPKARTLYQGGDSITFYLSKVPTVGKKEQVSPFGFLKITGEKGAVPRKVEICRLRELLALYPEETRRMKELRASILFGLVRDWLTEHNRTGRISITEYFQEKHFIDEVEQMIGGWDFSVSEKVSLRVLLYLSPP